MRKSQPFKRPYKWIVVCLLLAASVNLVGFAAQPKTVSIKVDGQTITLQTRALTVQGALEEAGVVLQTDMNWSAKRKNSMMELPSK